MDSWELAKGEIEEGAKLMGSALKRLTEHFEGGYRSYIRYSDRSPFLDYDRQIQHLEKAVWQAFVDRTEIKKIMSLKKIEELNKQLEDGKDLPPLTYENLCAMLHNVHDNTEQMLAEKIREVYDWLRPSPDGWMWKKYKTTQKSTAQGIGEKIILNLALRGWGSKFGLNERTENHVRGLDQIFHMLDHAPFPASHWGPLIEEIQKCDRVNSCGSTPYFRFRGFVNGNLHLWILRDDLRQRFNVIAGGNRIQSAEEKAAA